MFNLLIDTWSYLGLANSRKTMGGVVWSSQSSLFVYSDDVILLRHCYRQAPVSSVLWVFGLSVRTISGTRRQVVLDQEWLFVGEKREVLYRRCHVEFSLPLNIVSDDLTCVFCANVCLFINLWKWKDNNISVELGWFCTSLVSLLSI